jgi:Holliday junction DNA helicase RuvA
MIAFLRGTLASSGELAILEVGGMGFAVQVSSRTAQRLPPPGSSLLLYTWLQVRQDGLGLYGFLEAEERELFLLLQEVNGLGPKAALNLLSAFSWEKLVEIISQGDVSALVRVSGVGPKLAQRIVLEVKDRLLRRGIGGRGVVYSPAAEEALAALAALGYTPAEAEVALAQARQALGDKDGVADLVSYCLKVLGQQGR